MSVAVIGCGGVGVPAIAGSSLAGASKVIAVDVDDWKLRWARDMGATDIVNGNDADPVTAIQAVTDGNGADVVIDAVGRPETWKQAFHARDLAGGRRAGRIPDAGHAYPGRSTSRPLRVVAR